MKAVALVTLICFPLCAHAQIADKYHGPHTRQEAAKVTTGLPKRVGECVNTTITKVADRFGVPVGSPESMGTVVYFANGGQQASYELENSIVRSKVGDPARMCLRELPTDCPPRDERGKIYNTKNLRTGEAWTLPDAQHVCGGA